MTAVNRTRRNGRGAGAPGSAAGSAAERRRRPPVTVDDLLGMSQLQLDELFRGSRPGAIPAGFGAGTVIVPTPSPLPRVAASVARLGWRGKLFNRESHDLLNSLLPFGIRAVRAEVSVGTSLLDGKPAIVLDYSRTSLVAHYIRDEVREVAPGLYLGFLYFAGRRTINIVLAFGAQRD
ncbi:MAG: hypothetical protein ACM3UV_01340 [Nocardioidaceae bacterium]